MSTWALRVTTMTSLTRRRFISATVRSKLVAPSLGSSLMSMPNWPTNSGVAEFLSRVDVDDRQLRVEVGRVVVRGSAQPEGGTDPELGLAAHLVGVDVEPTAAAQADAEVQVPADGALDRTAVAGLQRQARDAEVDRQLAADALAELAQLAVGIEVVLAALGGRPCPGRAGGRRRGPRSAAPESSVRRWRRGSCCRPWSRRCTSPGPG